MSRAATHSFCHFLTTTLTTDTDATLDALTVVPTDQSRAKVSVHSPARTDKQHELNFKQRLLDTRPSP